MKIQLTSTLIIGLLAVTSAANSPNVHPSNAGSSNISPKFADVDHLEPKNLTVVEKWTKMEKNLHSLIKSAMKMALPKALEIAQTLTLSSTCVSQAMKTMIGIRDMKTWAFRFLDASGKSIDGMLMGTSAAMGDYQECIETVVTNDKPGVKGRELFQGQYCTFQVNLPMPPKRKKFKMETFEELKNFSKKDTMVGWAAGMAHLLELDGLKVSICVPSGCSIEDMDELAGLLADQTLLTIKTVRCEIKEEKNYTLTIIIVMAVYSLLGAVFLVGSLIGIYVHYTGTTFHNVGIRVLLCFSIITNCKRLFQPDASGTLSCFHGLRFLTLAWIMVCHTFGMFLLGANQIIRDSINILDVVKDLAFQVLSNAYLSADTFLCMGGFLISYIIMTRGHTKNRSINVKLYVIHRLWRIIPTYSFVIMAALVMPIFSSGPVWHEVVHSFSATCTTRWWTNFLFINNFYSFGEMCMWHTWYISCDFQLYIFSLLVLIPLLKWPKVGIASSILWILCSMAYNGIVTYVMDYPPAGLVLEQAEKRAMNEFVTDMHAKPFAHGAPYFLSILTGYLYAKKPNLKISRKWLAVGWCSAIVCNMSVLYGIWDWNNGMERTMTGTLFYATFNKVAWGAGVCWLMFCCSTGNASVVNNILSWSPFVPLARLTFLAYLVHPIVMMSFGGSLSSPIQSDHFLQVWLFFGNLCVSFGVAFALCMLIEAPFTALEKIIFPFHRSGDRTATVDNKVADKVADFQQKPNGQIMVITMPDSYKTNDAYINEDENNAAVCKL